MLEAEAETLPYLVLLTLIAECGLQEMALTSDLVSQLHSLGGIPEWEAYIAMHLPDHPDLPHLREKLVRTVLMRNAAYWEGQGEKQEFLKGLGFPWVWFLEAMAIYARANGNTAGENLFEYLHWLWLDFIRPVHGVQISVNVPSNELGSVHLGQN